MSKSRLQSNPLLQGKSDLPKKQDLPDKQDLSDKQKNTSIQGLQTGYVRATFIIKEDLLQNLKDYAYWERTTIKEVVEKALTDYNNKVMVPAIKKHKGGK